MIFSNHEFDKDQSYHDFLVAVHTKNLDEEFEKVKQFFTEENSKYAKEAQENGQNY